MKNQGWNLVGKMKKAGAVMLFLAVLGTASWIISDQSGLTGFVTSTDELPIRFTVDFSDITMDTQNASATESSTAIITNDDGEDEPLLFTATITKTDLDTDDCTDFESDCNVTFEYEGAPILNGDTIIVPSGDSELVTTISCVKWSCPGNISVDVSIDE